MFGKSRNILGNSCVESKEIINCLCGTLISTSFPNFEEKFRCVRKGILLTGWGILPSCQEYFNEWDSDLIKSNTYRELYLLEFDWDSADLKCLNHFAQQ